MPRRMLAFLLVAAFALIALLPCLVFSAGPGTSAATFLNLGFGARPMAMGESVVAMADDVSALHYNPAGLAFSPTGSSSQGVRKNELLVSHSQHIQDIRLSQLGLLRRPWGLSLSHLSLGGIERRSSETEQHEGTFGATDMALGFSYGRKIKGLGLGLGMTAKIIRQTIGEFSATAVGVDLGLLHRLERWPVSLGFSVVNLGSKVTFIEEGYSLPRMIRLGAAFGMTRKFPHALTLQLNLPRDNKPNVRLGLEYLGFGPFALRMGYRTMSSDQRQAALGNALGSSAPGLSEFYGMFMGVGFRYKLGSMDYTILPYGELGNAHRLSFIVRFGNMGGGGKAVKSKLIGVMQ